eukprot:6496613-Ditylum_brightwellii.AAC.1
MAELQLPLFILFCNDKLPHCIEVLYKHIGTHLGVLQVSIIRCEMFLEKQQRCDGHNGHPTSATQFP